MQAQTVSRPSVSGMPGYDDGMHPGGRPPKTPPTQLGQRIAAARERIGLSQVDLAQKLNVTQQTITAWERRSTVIKSDTLIRLASVLNVSVDELLGVAKSRPKPQVARGRLQKVLNGRPIYRAASSRRLLNCSNPTCGSTPARTLTEVEHLFSLAVILSPSANGDRLNVFTLNDFFSVWGFKGATDWPPLHLPASLSRQWPRLAALASGAARGSGCPTHFLRAARADASTRLNLTGRAMLSEAAAPKHPSGRPGDCHGLSRSTAGANLLEARSPPGLGPVPIDRLFPKAA
jgi:transcriptional regulator with XRE-family HTH domain